MSRVIREGLTEEQVENLKKILDRKGYVMGHGGHIDVKRTDDNLSNAPYSDLPVGVVFNGRASIINMDIPSLGRHHEVLERIYKSL